MTHSPHRVSKAPSARAVPKERLGFCFVLILVYLWVEYARPANPMGIPMAISIVLFIAWLITPRKNWSPQFLCFFPLLFTVAIMGPFAVNSFSIWMGFRNLSIQLLCIAIPVAHFVNSHRKFSLLVNCLILVFAYLAVVGILSGGRGPGGHVGDENDLAAALNVAAPFAFVSIFLAGSLGRKLAYGAAFGLMLLGVMFTFSRGGFLGLVAVLAYLFFLLPRKMPAISLGVLLAIGAWMYAPEGYWEEMATISDAATDTEHGTGALRREYWAVATRMFVANPLFGVGMGNYTWNVNEYQSRDQYERVGRSYAGNVAHSLYFTILAEVGLTGTLIYALIVWMNFRDLTAFTRLARGAVRSRVTDSAVKPSGTIDEVASDREIHNVIYYGHALRSSLIGFLVSSVFLTTFDYPHFWLLTALIVALKGITQATVSSPHLAVESAKRTEGRRGTTRSQGVRD